MDYEDVFPHVKQSVENFLFDEEGNIPRSKILTIGSMIIVLSMLLTEKVFAAHRTHSSHRTHSTHRTHSSHRSNGHTTHYTHSTHSTHGTHANSHSNTHATHNSHTTHSTHANTHSTHSTHANTHSTHSTHTTHVNLGQWFEDRNGVTHSNTAPAHSNTAPTHSNVAPTNAELKISMPLESDTILDLQTNDMANISIAADLPSQTGDTIANNDLSINTEIKIPPSTPKAN